MTNWTNCPSVLYEFILFFTIFLTKLKRREEEVVIHHENSSMFVKIHQRSSKFVKVHEISTNFDQNQFNLLKSDAL
jgi:hypothetical protein